MSERSSIDNSSSLSSRDFRRLSLTGSNIISSGNHSKGLKSMKQSHSQPELPTVQEMVNCRTNNKSSVWGIPHYHVPKIGTNINISKKITMAPRCKDGYIDTHKKLHRDVPASGTYEISKPWKTTVLGSMKGGKRMTYITKIFRDQQVKPSPGPGSYSPSSKQTKRRSNSGKISKSNRPAFTSEAEYLGTSSPAAIYIDPLKKKLPQPFKYNLKKKAHPWKVEKVDGPDPQSYAPRIEPMKKKECKNSTSKRKYFTDEAQLAKKDMPGAGTYNLIDYGKIHRRLNTKRH